MGMGDDMFFLGEAEKIFKETGQLVRPVGSGKSPLFNNVEFLSDSGVTVNTRDTTPEKTDYKIQYMCSEEKMTILGKKMVWRPYKIKPFHIRFTEKELETADKILEDHNVPKEFAAINPDFKKTFFGLNKNWGIKKYQELVDRLDLPCVRIMPKGIYKEPLIKGAINIESTDVRVSFAMLRNAKFGVGYIGMFIHALGGMGIPCVVLQGGIANTTIGEYPGHINIEYDHPESPCGNTYDCSHCADANEWMTVDMIFNACRKLL
jgi:hypothetical protein